MRAPSLFLILAILIISGCMLGSEETYKVSTTVEPSEGGSVAPGTGQYSAGELVEIEAMPNENWLFSEWRGDVGGAQNPDSITVDSTIEVIAAFQKIEYTLDVKTNGSGSVREKIVAGKSNDYPHGTNVKLTPQPNEGWKFDNWEGDVSGTEFPVTITVDENKSVIANFLSKTKVIGGNEYEQGHILVNTSDGGTIIAGTTESSDGDFANLDKGDRDIFVAKISPVGEINWLKTYGGFLPEAPADIIKSYDGNYLMAGSFWSNNGDFAGENEGEQQENIFVMKLNTQGDIIWTETLSGSKSDKSLEIFDTAQNDYILTGYTDSNDGDFSGIENDNSGAFITARFSSSGDFSSIYGNKNIDNISAIDFSNDELLVFGFYYDGDPYFTNHRGSTDIYFAKLNTEAEIIAEDTYGGSGGERIRYIYTTTTGDILATGDTSSDDGDFTIRPYGTDDAIVMNFSTNGQIQWVGRYGGSSDDIGFGITTLDGAIFATMLTYSNDGAFDNKGRGQSDIALIKLDQNGSLNWANTFGGFDSERPTEIIKKSDNLLITGSTESNDGTFTDMNEFDYGDIFLIKVDQSGDLKSVNE